MSAPEERAPVSRYTGHRFDCPTYDTLDASDCDCVYSGAEDVPAGYVPIVSPEAQAVLDALPATTRHEAAPVVRGEYEGFWCPNHGRYCVVA